MTTINREPAGTPAGGRFAAGSTTESTVQLCEPSTDQAVTTGGRPDFKTLMALAGYQGMGDGFNDVLRGTEKDISGHSPSIREYLQQEQVKTREQIGLIKDYLDQSVTTRDLTAYRGLSPTTFRELLGGVHPEDAVGFEMHDPGFMSTTFSWDVATQFGSTDRFAPEGDGAILELTVPSGTPAVDFANVNHGSNPQEELLLGPGQTIRFTQVRRQPNGGHHVFATLQPADPEPGASEPVTVTDAYGMRVAVTPGRLDDDADYVFMNGQCVGMAVALAEDRGWGVAVHTYTDEGLVKHAYAVDEHGTFWDVRGENDPVIVAEGLDEDDQLDYYRPSEVRFVLEETEDEDRVGHQNVELARTFVPAVLDLGG